MRKLGPASLMLVRNPIVAPHLRDILREISNLVCAETERRKGYATALMKKICKQADEEGIVLMVMVEPVGGDLSQVDLEQWYSNKFNFFSIQETPKIMIRQVPEMRKKLAAEAVNG